MKLSAGSSKLVTSSEPFRPIRHLPPCASDVAFADIVRVYNFTYLFTYFSAENLIQCFTWV